MGCFHIEKTIFDTFYYGHDRETVKNVQIKLQKDIFIYNPPNDIFIYVGALIG